MRECVFHNVAFRAMAFSLSLCFSYKIFYFFFLVRVDSESFPNFLFLFLYFTGGYVRIKNEKEKNRQNICQLNVMNCKYDTRYLGRLGGRKQGPFFFNLFRYLKIKMNCEVLKRYRKWIPSPGDS